MKVFIKYAGAISLLKTGWEIYTERGSNPYYQSLLFILSKSGEQDKNLHYATVRKLILEGVINGAGHQNKYGTI